MLKKRMIFTLLYSDGSFMLSRNFRLQKVGNLAWLEKNYNFRNVAVSIDELIILDVSRQNRDSRLFGEHIKEISKYCFIPIAAGGGIKSLQDARVLFDSGADKLVVNSIISKNPELVSELVKTYGTQCVIGSIDVLSVQNRFNVLIDNGFTTLDFDLEEYIDFAVSQGVGEIYLNSVDKDGTGQGYLISMLESISRSIPIPLILAGGAGNYHHLIEGLKNNKVDAVATANLFNFVGNGLRNARSEIINAGLPLVNWNIDEEMQYKGS